MKKLILPLLLLISISVNAQVLPSQEKEVDLRINQKSIKQGRNQLLAGFTISAIGTGLAVLAPSLVKEPVLGYSHEKYAKEVASLGDNDEARDVVVKRYNDSLTKYSNDLNNMDKKIKNIRGIGITGMSVGLVLNITGLYSMFSGLQGR